MRIPKCWILGPLVCAGHLLAQAPCTVAPFEAVDATRTRGLPFASGSDPGAVPHRTRALVFLPGAAKPETPPAYLRDLLLLESPGADPVKGLAAALLFYGIRLDESKAATLLATPGACRAGEVVRGASPVVVLLSALPAVLYTALAEELAARGVATVVTRGAEADVRLLLQALAFPADRVALVGHGAGGATASLLAMSWSGVKAVVSLDGFEALDRARHPGLTASAGWKPGHLRAPVLLVQPQGRPHADSAHYDRALRSDLTHVEVVGLSASPWTTSADLAFAPQALRPLLPNLEPAVQQELLSIVVRFVEEALAGRAPKVPAMSSARLVVSRRKGLASPAVRADGVLDEPLWRTARELLRAAAPRDAALAAAAGEAMAVKLAEDCDYVYVALAASRPTPFSTEVYFDSKGDGGEAWRPDDLLLHASQSLCWGFGSNELARESCGSGEAWWGASRTVSNQDPPVAEYIVAKRKLGLEPCAPAAALRLAARLSGVSSSATFPASADPAKPSTWIPAVSR